MLWATSSAIVHASELISPLPRLNVYRAEGVSATRSGPGAVRDTGVVDDQERRTAAFARRLEAERPVEVGVEIAEVIGDHGAVGEDGSVLCFGANGSGDCVVVGLVVAGRAFGSD